MRRFIAQPVLVALALALGIMVLGGGEPAAAVDIDFEVVPGVTATPEFSDGRSVPDSAQLSIQLQDTHGVIFSSPAGYVALVQLGRGHATSELNGIAPVAVVSGRNVLNYDSPVVITFTMAGARAVTDFVSIRGDLQGGVGTVTMRAFDVNNVLLKSATASNAPGVVLSLMVPNIHWVEIAQTASAFMAFDDLKFNPLSSYLGQAPVANAGPDQKIRAGQTIALDGTGSDDDDTATDKLGFAWTFVRKPDGSGATLSDANSPKPWFFADLPGDYAVSLTVTDAAGLESAPDTVAISSTSNTTPVADAGGDQGAFVGAVVSLDGSASSDPDGDRLGFSWTLTKPQGSAATLAGPMTKFPSFTADVPGTYVATLSVDDPFGANATDDVAVSVITVGNLAQDQVMRALNVISRLTSAHVTTKGNQNALQQHLAQVITALQGGDIAHAVDKVIRAIERTDGCALRGGPDGDGEGRDWVIECGAQAQVYPLLMAAWETLMR